MYELKSSYLFFFAVWFTTIVFRLFELRLAKQNLAKRKSEPNLQIAKEPFFFLFVARSDLPLCLYNMSYHANQCAYHTSSKLERKSCIRYKIQRKYLQKWFVQIHQTSKLSNCNPRNRFHFSFTSSLFVLFIFQRL